MRIWVGQYDVLYNYNPMGRFYNFWFLYRGKVIHTATLFKTEYFIEALKVCKFQIDHERKSLV